MDYKTILVHLDDARTCTARVAYAAQLANQHGAHLLGLTTTGIARLIRGSTVPGEDLGDLTPLFAVLRDDAESRTQAFDTLAEEAGVASFEHRIDEDEPGTVLAMQGMYADLVILGSTDAPEPGHSLGAGIPEYVAMNSPSPVLVLPQTDPHAATFERVLVAWNASPEAARAVRLALPFLTRASEVSLALFEEESRGGLPPAGGDDIARFLARHGVATDVRRPHARGDVGHALLVLANKLKADLLVMGCYGHSRYREILLGGVSRTVLGSVPLPILLAH